MIKVAHFDATIHARRRSVAGPLYLNGGRVGQATPTPTRPVPSQQQASRRLPFQQWLEASAIDFRTANRLETCKRFECYRRGTVYMTEAELDRGPAILTAAVRIG